VNVARSKPSGLENSQLISRATTAMVGDWLFTEVDVSSFCPERCGMCIGRSTRADVVQYAHV
jgi:hypothetical protein